MAVPGKKGRCYMLMAVGAFVLLGMVFTQNNQGVQSYIEPLTEKNTNALNFLKNNKQIGNFLGNMNKKDKKEMKDMVNSLLD